MSKHRGISAAKPKKPSQDQRRAFDRVDPTPELAKRKAEATRGSDPALSTYSLDRMYANKGWLNEAQRKAGWRYTTLRYAVFGKCVAQIPGYSDVASHFETDPSDIDESKLAEIELEFILADDALRDCGPEIWEAVRTVCLDDIDVYHEYVRSGLTHLANYFGLEQ